MDENPPMETWPNSNMQPFGSKTSKLFNLGINSSSRLNVSPYDMTENWEDGVFEGRKAL